MNRKEMTSDQRRRIAIRNKLSGACFIAVPRSLPHFVSAQSAILLCYLIGICRMVKAEERARGWFYCKVARVEAEIGMTRGPQVRFLRELRTKRLIRVEKKGNPAKRFIWIDFDRLDRRIEDIENRLAKRRDSEDDSE